MESGTAARVFWITGLSGAGKSTISVKLRHWLQERGMPTVMLDGDAVRDLLLNGGAHDRASRLEAARFYGRLCKFLADQGVSVICPTISLFHEVQAWNRAHIPGYVEIFLDAGIDEVRRRDPKGVYRRAAEGSMRDVVGLDIEAEYPREPDFVIKNHVGQDADATFGQLASWLHEHLRKGS